MSNVTGCVIDVAVMMRDFCALKARVAALETKVENFTSTNKPSATCLLCGHMEVCYYYKHSGGGCCGKFVPRTSHVG